MNQPISAQTLEAMKAYYQERASEYDEFFYRRGRYDRGPDLNARWFAECDEVFAALDAFRLEGDVLELAAGTGIWTQRLVQRAGTVTAVDASSEMIAINRAKVANTRASYIQADLFFWRPERAYDGVFFGFWLSHVPRERLDDFLATVAQMLLPGGKLFFLDSLRTATSTAVNQQLPELESQLSTRILNNGQTFEIVKNYFDPDELTSHCARAGLSVETHHTETYFYYGAGTRQA